MDFRLAVRSRKSHARILVLDLQQKLRTSRKVYVLFLLKIIRFSMFEILKKKFNKYSETDNQFVSKIGPFYFSFKKSKILNHIFFLNSNRLINNTTLF